METRTAPTMSYSEICKRLSKLTTTSICDAHKNVRLMENTISPIGEKDQCIGRAYTVYSEQDSLSTMLALDDLQAFLGTLDCSDDIVPIILVIASCNAPYAIVGGMCANVAKAKGFVGLVTDGLCRDIKEIKASELPFFAKGKCAKSGPKDKIGSTKEKIQCGGIDVNPGEIIFADIDGIVVMSKEEAASVISISENIQSNEQEGLRRVKAGARFDEICNIKEHVESLRSGIPSKLKLT